MTTHHSPVVRPARSSHLSARSGALRLMALLFTFVAASICLPAAAQAAKRPVQVTEQQIARGKKMCIEADKLLAAGKTTEALKKYKEVLAFLPESPWAKRGVAKAQAGGKAPASGLAPEAPGSAGSAKKPAPADAGDAAGDGSGGGLPMPMKGGLALLALVVVFGLVKAVRRKRTGRGDAVVDAPIESMPPWDATGTPVAATTTEDASSAEQAAAAAVVAAAAAGAAAAEPEAPAAPAESAAEEFSFDDLQTVEAAAATAGNPFAAPEEQTAAEEEPTPLNLPAAAAEGPAGPVAEAPAGPFAEAPAAPEAKAEEPSPAGTFISFAQPEEPTAPAPAPAVPEVAAEEKDELPAAFLPFAEPEPAAAPEVQAQEEQPAVEATAPPVFAPFGAAAEEPAPAAAAEDESIEAAVPAPPPAYTPFGVSAETAEAAEESEAPTPFGAVEETAEAASPFGAVDETEEAPTPFGVVEEAEEAPSPFGAVSEEEPAEPFAPVVEQEAESAPSPFGAQEEEEAPAMFPGLAAAPAAAAGAAAVDREGASERARLWWESAGTNADTCEVCGAVMQRGEGFHLDTAQMSASASYIDFDTRMQTMLGLDEEAAAKQVQERLDSHAEAWHVCEQCLSQHFAAQ